VLAEGYAWNGATYSSLSEVARVITGTRWNGWTFFGLQPKRAKMPRARKITLPASGMPPRLPAKPASSATSQGVPL
jgi:hypothetical protein